MMVKRLIEAALAPPSKRRKLESELSMKRIAVNYKTCILYYYILLQNPDDPTIQSSWRQCPLFLTLSRTCIARRRGILEARKPLRRYTCTCI